MDYVTTVMIFALVAVTPAHTQFQYFGGSMSFTCTRDSITNKTEVTIDVITSWELGRGPCGQSCSPADLGQTTQTALVDPRDFLSNFGHWTTEVGLDNSHSAQVTNIDYHVVANMSRTVLLINVQESWELERMRFVITIDTDKTGISYQDIIYEGTGWHMLSEQGPGGNSLPWHLQTKIRPHVRSDTGRPNNSPLVLVRPLYRIKLGRLTSIPIPTSDPDGDLVQCRSSVFVEAGQLYTFTQQTGMEVKPECVLSIDATGSNGFHDDMWLAALLTVSDYNQVDMIFGEERYQAFYRSISSTLVQFMVHVMESVSAPEFIDPSPAPNHKVLMYVGATWVTELHAKAFNGSVVDQFFVFARQGEKVLMSNISDSTLQPDARFVSLSWTPSTDDVGSHVVCISVIDDMGTMADEDRCLLFDIREYTYEHVNGSQVIFFPGNLTDTEFITGVTHVMPIYINGSIPLQSLTVPQSNVDIQHLSHVTSSTSGNPPNHMASLQFRHNTTGEVSICMKAEWTNSSSKTRCLKITIVPPNQCSIRPCANSGSCRRHPYNPADYICLCLPDFIDKNCQTKMNPCIPMPCVQGKCLRLSGRIYKCVCLPGFKGKDCDINVNDCIGEPCGNNGVCVDGVNNYTCQCFSRYVGVNCTTDTCPAATQGATKCPSGTRDCLPDPCNGRGVCLPGPVCVCRRGYTGQHCEQREALPPSLSTVALTIEGGSTVRCQYNETGAMPCRVRLYFNSPNGQPYVTVRSGSPNAAIQGLASSPLTEKINGVLDLYATDVIIWGNRTSADNQLCVNASRSNHDDDVTELCFQVEYFPDPLTDPGSIMSLQQNASQQFIFPSSPEGSQLTCAVNTHCSMFLYTKTSTGKCDQMLSPSDNVTVFEPTWSPTSDQCEHEAAYTFSHQGNRTICFKTGLASFQTRCYEVQIVDACTIYVCSQGVCISHEETPVCLCRAGWTGPHCETDSLLSLDGKANSPSFIGSAAIPRVITCDVNTTCHISLPMPGYTGRLPSVSLGHVGPGLAVTELSTDFVHSDHGYGQLEANVRLTTGSAGLYPLCLQLTGHSGKLEELCVRINTTSDAAQVDQTRPFFVFPTIPTLSTLVCERNKDCHISFTYANGSAVGNSSETCPSVKDSSPDPIELLHIFPAQVKSRGCVSDVTIRPLTQQQTLCLSIGVQGTSGEKRCFNILATDPGTLSENVLTSCPGVGCTNGGHCTAEVKSSQCSTACQGNSLPLTNPEYETCDLSVGGGNCNVTFSSGSSLDASTRNCADVNVTSHDDITRLVAECFTCQAGSSRPCSIDACFHGNDGVTKLARVCVAPLDDHGNQGACLQLAIKLQSTQGDGGTDNYNVLAITLPLFAVFVLGVLTLLIILLLVKKRDENKVRELEKADTAPTADEAAPEYDTMSPSGDISTAGIAEQPVKKKKKKDFRNPFRF